MKINLFKKVQVEAKTFHIFIKCRDEFGGAISDQDKNLLIHKDDGYVPDFMPDNSILNPNATGTNMGDYLILDIDLDSGQILNWKKPTSEQIEDFIEKCE